MPVPALSFTDRLRRLSQRIRQLLYGVRLDAESPRLYVAPLADEAAGRHPSRIGSWKVLGVLGEGTSATVFRVVPTWAPDSTEHYALKLHERRQAGEKDARDRFRREMRILRTIKHRNVVQLIETGEFQGRQFMVMELVEGRNLRQALERHQPQLTGRLDWSIQIARALGAMHDCGIVHRDLKPENILTTRVGVVKLADFGLALNAENGSVTQVGFLVGTPAYMAPEYLLGREPDSRSDLYSFGVILYELFTGEMPYNATSLGDFIEAHIEAPPIPPRSRVATLPRELELVILRLLEKKPARRFQSADDVRAALEKVLALVVGVRRAARENVA